MDTENELLKQNQKLVYMVLYRHFPKYVNDDDIFQIGMIGLLKAIRSYDESKCMLSTYATRCIFNEIAQEFQNRNREMRTAEILSLDQEWSDDGRLNLLGLIEDEKTDIQSETVIIINQYIAALTGRRKQILMLMALEYNYAEIGEIIGLSRARVSQLSKEIIEKLDSKLGGVKNGRKRRKN